MNQRTLIFIKPGHVHLKEKVLKRLDMFGRRIMHKELDKAPRRIIEEHYSPHKAKSFFKELVEEFADKPVVVAIYEGEDVIQKVIDATGPTDPLKAPKGTIRRDFTDEKVWKMETGPRLMNNVMHRSDHPKEFEREFTVWKEIFDGK